MSYALHPSRASEARPGDLLLANVGAAPALCRIKRIETVDYAGVMFLRFWVEGKSQPEDMTPRQPIVIQGYWANPPQSRWSRFLDLLHTGVLNVPLRRRS